MNVAIIPARGGSKRIPRKNIREFHGLPMMAWSIKAAQAADVFDRVVVSTDDEEIADVAKRYGAEAPFRRPPELANDTAPTMPVVADAIKWWEEHRSAVDFACCIYPTAPFLESNYLRKGFELLKTRTDADFVFSVTSYAFTIFRSLKQNPDGTVKMYWPENELIRSQDLPEAWHDAGQFYWGRRDAFFENEGFFSAHSYPIVLPRQMVQDIDTPEDWKNAELMFLVRQLEKKSDRA